MTVTVTIEYSHDLDMEARESVQITHRLSLTNGVTADDVRAALRAFREVLEKVPVEA